MLRFRDMMFFAAKPSFAQSYRNRGEAAENFYGQNWSQLRTQVENRAEAVETTFFLSQLELRPRAPTFLHACGSYEPWEVQFFAEISQKMHCIERQYG